MKLIKGRSKVAANCAYHRIWHRRSPLSVRPCVRPSINLMDFQFRGGRRGVPSTIGVKLAGIGSGRRLEKIPAQSFELWRLKAGAEARER